MESDNKIRDEIPSYSVVDLLKNVLRPKTNRYRKFVTCNILT